MLRGCDSSTLAREGSQSQHCDAKVLVSFSRYVTVTIVSRDKINKIWHTQSTLNGISGPYLGLANCFVGRVGLMGAHRKGIDMNLIIICDSSNELDGPR